MRHTAIALTLLLTFAASAAEVSGVVRGADGQPLANAHVYVYAAYPLKGMATTCPSCYRDCGKREQTDAKGAYRIAKLDDTLKFELLAVADGYEPRFVKPVLNGDHTTIQLTRRSAQDAKRLVTGFVVDPQGKPLVGAVVEPSGYHTPPRALPNGRTTTSTGYGSIPGLESLSVTNANGEFALMLPDAAGSLDVRVTARSYAPKIERNFVPAQPKTIQVTEPAMIEGRVVRDGKPLANVPVRVHQRNRSAANFLGFIQIATDDQGRFAVPNLGIDTEWVVFVPHDFVEGGVIEPKLITTGGPKTMVDAGTLEMTEGRTIKGVVKTTKHGPKVLTLSNWITGEAWSTHVHADGSFTFEDIPRGEVRLGSPEAILSNTPEATESQRHIREVQLAAEGNLLDVTVFAIE